MPNDSALRSFLAELSPEDITTLVGRLSRLMPQGAAVYSPELNAGEAELVAKRRAERDAARARELEIMEQMLPQMAARRRAAVPEAQADVFVPTRPRVMRESPFMFTQPQSSRAYAGGGPVLGDQTMPDVSDSGQMFMDPMPFAGGGKVEALKLLKGDLFHGGSYKKGDTITQPLYTTPSREMAETYVDEYRNPGSTLKQLRPNVKNPAPERLVNAASRRYVPENERMGYTPASAFDQNLHDPRAIAKMIAELRRRGYDSAVATDIGMSGPGAVEAPALIAFPGAKAYAKGGKVGTKTLDEMQAELMSKQGLTRRSLFGLPTQSQQYPLSKVEQEVQRIEQQARKKGEAPAVSTARVDVDPGTGSKRSVMESLVETPMSRRTVLKTAGSQAMQSMLPMGDVAKALDVPVPTGALSQATQAAPVIPVVTEAMIPGLVAEGLQMGLSFPRVMKMVQGELGTGLKNLGEADIERMYYNLFDPYSATNIPGTTRAGDAWRAMTGVEGAFGFPFTQLRQSMRSVRKADPELYETLKKLSRDIAEYGPE
jgi:hypothetical protein